MVVVLRELASRDLAAVVELNNDAVPAVPLTDEDEMAVLTAVASLALVAVDDADAGSPLGFLVAIDPGADYGSENYRFFSRRDSDFLYVDRIVVDGARRGAGIGRMLYGAVFERARADARAEVTCEVNLRPPNPGSLAFHEVLGFRRVGEQSTKGGTVRVALLAAEVVG